MDKYGYYTFKEFVNCYEQVERTFFRIGKHYKVIELLYAFKPAMSHSLKEAAEGDSDASIRVGKIVEMELGGSATSSHIFSRAFKYYSEAVDKNNPQAMVELANLYLRKGLAVHPELNYDKAIPLYEQAISLGSRKAALHLASLYEHGNQEVEQDRNKAITLYETAWGLPKDPSPYENSEVKISKQYINFKL